MSQIVRQNSSYWLAFRVSNSRQILSMAKQPSASSLGKALQLILMLADEQQEIGTSELARKLDMHKATASRILIKLAEYGFVYKNKETRKYWLGPSIHQMGMTMAYVSFNEILEVARRKIDKLRDELNETVALEIWLGNSTVTTYYALPNHPDIIVPPPGKQLALHSAAGAKAILAYTHPDRVDTLLDAELTKLTKNTLTDLAEIKSRLANYLKQGFALDYEEMHIGICASAAPIFDQLKRPTAAIVVLVPPNRAATLTSPKLITQLKATTSVISKELSAKQFRAI